MFKVNNKNIRAMSDVVLVFLLTLNIFLTFFSVSIVDFAQENNRRLCIYYQETMKTRPK